MKPFLLLATRAEDLAADGEYEAMCRFAGLRPAQLRRVRMERAPLGAVDLDAYSGIVLGGGPFNVSDPPDTKSPAQTRVEAELRGLLEIVVQQDFPFFGACYGIGAIGTHRGGLVDRQFGEAIGAVTITLTDDGVVDPLFAGVSRSFEAFVGHKEAITRLPAGAVALATSPGCPVQAFKLGDHVYATQFHPELDLSGLETRIDVYRDYGYFQPSQSEQLKVSARTARVTEPGRLLANFVARYARA